MERRKQITIDIEKCNGCRSCELACSFHRLKTFDPSNSSIRVYRNDGEGNLELSIISTCDGCPDETMPLCSLFCSSGCLSYVGELADLN
ncbi:MAG: hypothetical protein ISS61_09230 [Desulfobacteraceae bacterium]|nr:hypothetical protein [Desulfobacteraceae bacterium]